MARQVVRRDRNARFRRVSPLDDKPAAIAAELAGGGRDRIPGRGGGVRPMIAHSALFVVSLYCKGLPRSSLEVMSMAISVATTDDPGCRETVTDQVNHALARMGVASRERVLAPFSAARVNARILVMLRECLE